MGPRRARRQETNAPRVSKLAHFVRPDARAWPCDVIVSTRTDEAFRPRRSTDHHLRTPAFGLQLLQADVARVEHEPRLSPETEGDGIVEPTAGRTGLLGVACDWGARTPMVDAFGITETGPVRATNEDCFLADEALSLFVVADGMGGHAAGEVASQLAVDVIQSFMRCPESAQDVSWPGGLDSTLSDAGNRLRTAIYLANRRVYLVAAENERYAGMGTTVVCALIDGARLAIGHVGDSRLYVLSQGVLVAYTRDDTWAETILGEQADARAIAEHPMRNVLTNVLGARDQTEIHLVERPLTDGETILLCTDGVHSVLDDGTLAELLSRPATARELATSVVSTALARGSRDNATALVVRCIKVGHEAG
jgi:PPM family protein phosphatase